MTIGLLICDHVAEALRPVAGDYADMFAALFARHGSEVSLNFYDLQQGDYPRALDECDGYLSTGSRFSVYDREPWILRFRDLVRALYQEKRKFVGICFGHQMIAHALGGSCVKSGSGWGVGVHEVAVCAKKPWMEPEQGAYNLIVCHQDQVVALPADAERLGGNAHCPYAMVAVGDHFLGIQAHPEFNTAYVEALMRTRVEQIGRSVVQQARRSLHKQIDEAVVVQWMLNFFRAS